MNCADSSADRTSRAPDLAEERVPDVPPPPNAEWLGEWVRTTVSTYTTDPDGGPGDWERDQPVWMREYLQLDGHEDCCHHTWPVFLPLDFDGDRPESMEP